MFINFLSKQGGTAIKCSYNAKNGSIARFYFHGSPGRKNSAIPQFKLLVWWRYINDIFLLWEHGEEQLNEFWNIFNCFYPSIKFTLKCYREQSEFSDVEIIKGLLTNEFAKSTDTHK